MNLINVQFSIPNSYPRDLPELCHLSVGLWLYWFRGRFGPAGCAKEDLLSVRESEVASIGAIGSVLCLIAIDKDFGSNRQRVFSEATPKQSVGCAALDHPACRGAVGVLDIDMNPRMWVDQLYFRDSTAK